MSVNWTSNKTQRKDWEKKRKEKALIAKIVVTGDKIMEQFKAYFIVLLFFNNVLTK